MAIADPAPLDESAAARDQGGCTPADRAAPPPRRPSRRWRSARRAGAVAVVGACALAVVATAATWALTPATGNLLRRVAALDHAHHTTVIAPDAVPPLLAEAVVAVEDAQFYHDHGINIEGLLRAAAYDLTHRCTCQGGSTITQQLAEDVYLHGWDGTLPLRWEDVILALKIEGHLSKRQILAAYLSEVYLGGGAYGAAAASRRYFHRPLARDTLAQAALLAGLPQAPSAFDPLVHPDAARDRRHDVLQAMVAAGDISAAAADRAARAPV